VFEGSSIAICGGTGALKDIVFVSVCVSLFSFGLSETDILTVTFFSTS
jgi:hypothetical protein